MTTDQLARWEADFKAFHARFAPFFERREPREHAQHYLRGLLSPAERKNTWQMAEALGQDDPQGLQRLLSSSPWDADAVGTELQRFVVEQFGDPAGIAVLDETAFVKKGNRSAGVKRQWCSPLGKTENCQVGVFLAYVSPKGYAFLDRRLYLPKEWADDAARREAARVPEEVAFATKPQLGQAMLEAAWERGVPMEWVTGDETYGDQPKLRDRIVSQGLKYVLAVSANTWGWETPPAVEPPTRETGGRPRQHPRLAADAPPAQTVAQIVASWPAERWQRLAIAAGEKGPRIYDWACARIVVSRDGLPGESVWLVARRSITKPAELAYYLAHAPEETPLWTLAQVAGARWTVEQCFEEAKGETGLDHYEVRYWQSWHRHITLSMMAHAWLTAIRRLEAGSAAEKKAGGGTRGAERSRGAPAPGNRPAAAARIGGTEAGLVTMAAGQAPASAAQPLPTAHRFPACAARCSLNQTSNVRL
jgi:SRSO17 transposase